VNRNIRSNKKRENKTDSGENKRFKKSVNAGIKNDSNPNKSTERNAKEKNKSIKLTNPNVRRSNRNAASRI